MDLEITKRAMEILRRALELAPAERRDFLAASCADDRELLAEVESLLAAEDDSVDFIEDPLVPRQPEDGLPESRQIGPYRLVERLAQGGMGVVYLAERADEEFEQRVAIKLVRRGLDSEEFIRRFRYERQILAQLDHPNIARLLDGGTTEDGVPYFVMEHVEGEPVDHHCAVQKVGLRERLRLFLEICGAVEFAHRNLVIHRDLKPANVLVNVDGVVKLLDFGIARLLETEDDAYRTQQVLEGHVFTPEYASPEQLRAEAVTTASDVYSLGILLYELLAGTKPFTHRDPLDPEMLEERHRGPTRPSRAEAVIVAGHPPIHPRLAGDLDAIVVKALRFEAAERYGSVEQLVDDIERYLTGRPVLARRGTWLYTASKYLRRHRVKVTLLVLGIVLITSLVSNFEQRSRMARDRARAAVMRDLVNDLLTVGDPRSEARASTPREILERGAEQAEDRLAGQPGDLAEILTLMGRAFRRLDENERARAMHERSVELVRRNLGDRHPQLAFSLNDLAAVLIVEREIDGADDAAREALAIVEAQVEPDRELLAAIYNNIAIVHSRYGEYSESEMYHRQALALKLDLYGAGDHESVARTYNNLGRPLEFLGEIEEAEQNFMVALDMRSRLFDGPHPDLEVSYNNLGVLYCDQDNPAAGLPLVETGLEMRRVNYPDNPDHQRILRALRNLGVCHQVAGNLERAGELYAEALQKQLGASEEPGIEVARTLREIAALHLERGEAALAEREIRRALDIFRGVYSEGDHWRIADAESVLGGALLALGRAEEAQPLLTRSVTALETDRPRSRPLREALERASE